MPDHGTGIGVIDIEAGLPFAPEAAATREFAAHTLNFCLGFQLEEAAYSFSEADTVTYPADIQVAVNRGWFALENGAFLPEQPITAAEKDAMLADAAQVLAGDVIVESYESTYEFSEEVIELPENTVAQLSSDTELVLASPATPIAQGDIFVVYLDGFPVVYQADAVSVSGTVYTVTVTNLNINNYLTGVDAQGSASVDLADFIPEDDVEPIYVLEDGTEVSRAQLRATNKIKSIYFVKNIDGYSVNIQIYDMKLNWRSTGWTLSRLEVSAVVTGQMDVSISLPFGVDASDLDVDLTLGRIPIGGECFRRCSALADVELSASLREISNWYAFGDCVSLTSIFIPKSLEAAAQQTFGGCTNLKNVTFEDGMTRIPNYILHGCPGIEKIVIPDSVSAIGRNAFEGAVNLSDVTMPDSVTKIEDTAFSGCTSLEEIQLPANLVTIGAKAFSGCTALKAIDIPDTVTTIDTKAFQNCSALETVELSEKLVDMDGPLTFSGCSALKSITIPESLTKCGLNTFTDCTSLESVTLHGGMTELAENMFKNCDSRTTVTIPYGVTKVSNNCFYDCDALQTVDMANSVTKMGTNVFRHCDNLQNVKLSLKLAAVPNDSFRECAKLAEIVIPYYCTSIGSNAFNASPKLAKVVTHGSLTSIGTSAFTYPNTTVFCGIPGSYTETWCGDNGFAFNENTTAATEVTLSDKTVSILMGNTYTPGLSVTPIDFADTITFKSGNTDVATVDETGLITAITPADASNQVLKWTSSNEAAATVDANGVVTAIAKGTATITAAATDDSGVTAICNVTVTNNAYVVTDVSALESSHNYPNGCSDFWLYTAAGADSLLVTFDARTEMEDGFDYLHICDGAGSLVGTYTGGQLSGITVEVPGDTIKIQLDSDDVGTEWGFKVTEVKVQKQTTVIASGWSGATQWTLTDDGTLTIFGEGNMKNYAYGGG